MGTNTHTNLRGKQALLFGLARTHVALARYLVREGARVTITDRKPADQLQSELHALEHLPVRLLLGRQDPEEIAAADIIFVTPGAPRNLPVFDLAHERGVPFSSEIELLFERCPVPVTAITGSSGKTTTTTLVGEMLKASYGAEHVWVGGNIGTPLIDQLDRIAAVPDAQVVLELSSFQLEHMQRSPHVGAVLNITPNHLDRHGTMAAYAEAKAQIIRHQHEQDYAILNADDAGSSELRHLVRGTLLEYSMRGQVEVGACLSDDTIVLCLPDATIPVCRTGEIKLIGRHNIENVVAACAITLAAGGMLPNTHAMRQVATSFSGVAHRLEFVREKDGVRYYNDSIATAPERTMAALRAFPSDDPIILIAGGKHKNVPLDDLAHLIVDRVEYLLLTGADAGLMEEAVCKARHARHSDTPHMERCTDLVSCVMQAAQAAAPGSIVLLSPAFTSYDRYRDFEERGQEFRDAVHRL